MGELSGGALIAVAIGGTILLWAWNALVIRAAIQLLKYPMVSFSNAMKTSFFAFLAVAAIRAAVVVVYGGLIHKADNEIPMTLSIIGSILSIISVIAIYRSVLEPANGERFSTSQAGKIFFLYALITIGAGSFLYLVSDLTR
jgi:hypothetical protein